VLELRRAACPAAVPRRLSALQSLFPGVISGQTIDIERTVALDHPLLSEARLGWENGSLTRLKSARFEPPNGAESAADPPIFEACLQAAYGPATKRNETDQMKANDASEWSLESDGEIDVDETGVVVRLETLVWSPREGRKPRRMSKAGWQRFMGVLDACGSH
jgi:hypothetical protein